MYKLILLRRFLFPNEFIKDSNEYFLHLLKNNKYISLVL